MEKRALQITVAIAALVPVLGGLWGMSLPSPDGAWTINHSRYLSGLLLGIGLGFWSTVPEIEVKSARIRLLTAIVMVGGLARFAGVMMGDALTPPVVAALSMELCVTPVLCHWQSRMVSRQHLLAIARLGPHLRHIAP